MTQKSYPWGYQLGDDSMVPYTAKEWYAVWNTIARSGGMVIDSGLRTVATFANMGVFYSVANRFVVTNPGAAANRIAVDTGAALVDGSFFYNTASVSSAGNVTSPAANPRIDRVVIRKNYNAASYVPANASAADFTVETQTARITVIHGAENVAPVAPALTQDTTRATYWDIPLYQYQISVAGAISAITDEREWVDATTKNYHVAAYTGRNETDNTDILMGVATGGQTWPDAKLCGATFIGIVPNDFLGSFTITPVVTCPIGAGDLYGRLNTYYGACAADPATHNDDTGYAALAVTNAVNNCLVNQVLTTAAVGDIVRSVFERDATDPLDTIGQSVGFSGFTISYLGWR